ncbi:MAG: molybdopterin oxidoreductase family protein [Chloroflexia bacterium]
MQETRDSISDVWGPRTPYYDAWPERVDARVAVEPDQWVQSACVLCSNGCALDIGVKDGRIVGVRGRAVDRVNHGRLGPKGLNGWEANNSPDRLTVPLVRRDGELVETTWDEAWTLLVQNSRDVLENYGPGAFAFYNTGQLFLEEYYTLGVIGKAGIGTPHMDGNTRLCTATAATAMFESFGSDGQVCSYRDIDLTDALFHIGHNVAATQTVLWSRILDRLAGPNPPKLVVVDPRTTPTAKMADVHLTPKAGTNVPLLNGIINLLIEAGQVNHEYIAQHTIGFEQLQETAAKWPANRVEQITGVPEMQLKAAAEIIGTAPTLISSCLQGVYQSMQATAAACQVNNIHLIRGLLGKPGCGVLQMNGQPTAQNTRECGANGELPGFRNWSNQEHVKELAKIWNVDVTKIPHATPPTHAMEMFRYAEEGSIRLLWIICTNPAVSMPDAGRIRDILRKKGLFVVVQDAFLTETGALADLVLPAAMWGEKTGTFTNADRTVHISYKAVEPPGQARSDLDIFLDFARLMDFQDQAGAPLIKWSDPEGAFEAWKVCSKGRPCDYSGMSYAKLTGGSGIPWPCNEQYPNGKERLYEDAIFPTDPDYCEEYGHDLATGAALTRDQYLTLQPQGRAFIKAADYIPPVEQPDDDYPLWYSTGRVVYHFHTRTKTARAAELQAAAPEVFVQISAADAEKYGVGEGDIVEVASRRGKLHAPARIGDIEEGHIFVPFHYGYWDRTKGLGGDGRNGKSNIHNGDGHGGDAGGDHDRAANELTLTSWDPVSKQPHFKFAAVKIRVVQKVNVQARRTSPVQKAEVGASAQAKDHASPAQKPLRK